MMSRDARRFADVLTVARNEFFSIIDGKKTDAHLHDGILAGADPVEVDKLARENARNVGLSEEQILTLFGPPLTGSE